MRNRLPSMLLGLLECFSQGSSEESMAYPFLQIGYVSAQVLEMWRQELLSDDECFHRYAEDGQFPNVNVPNHP